MLFNSLQFLIFLPIVFILYWFAVGRNFRIQNALLLVASYFFYGSWDYRFLFLLIFSTLLDFYSGLMMERAKDDRSRKMWFTISVCINLGFLAVFKYFDFFSTSFAQFVSSFGFTANPILLEVILPVGISFYTFHGLSYVIDIYYKRIQPEKNFVDYAVFVSYFPLLVAGPIERATHLLPQIKKPRSFDSKQAIHGVELIIWGLFKKVVIADTLASFINQSFAGYESYSGMTLAMAAVAFSFQIYCDFSGYSDMAIGTSKLFGIELLRNFNFPYLSRNIAEFWRRWHISLSSWFRDYVYIPLGGSKVGKLLSVRNVFIVFLLSGIWHGANWTFLIWGAIHALLFIPSFIFGTNRKFQENIVSTQRWFPAIGDLIRIGFTFSLVTIAWIFFRATTLNQAGTMVKKIFTLAPGELLVLQNNQIFALAISFMFFIAVSIYHLYRSTGVFSARLGWQFSVALMLMLVITLFGEFSESSFIYFQF